MTTVTQDMTATIYAGDVLTRALINQEPAAFLFANHVPVKFLDENDAENGTVVFVESEWDDCITCLPFAEIKNIKAAVGENFAVEDLHNNLNNMEDWISMLTDVLVFKFDEDAIQTLREELRASLSLMGLDTAEDVGKLKDKIADNRFFCDGSMKYTLPKFNTSLLVEDVNGESIEYTELHYGELREILVDVTWINREPMLGVRMGIEGMQYSIKIFGQAFVPLKAFIESLAH